MIGLGKNVQTLAFTLKPPSQQPLQQQSETSFTSRCSSGHSSLFTSAAIRLEFVFRPGRLRSMCCFCGGSASVSGFMSRSSIAKSACFRYFHNLYGCNLGRLCFASACTLLEFMPLWSGERPWQVPTANKFAH